MQFKAQKQYATSRYGTGQKRCQMCEVFIIWNGIRCPCCGYRLRCHPRNSKNKRKIVELYGK